MYSSLLLERQALDARLRREAVLITRALVRQAEHQVGHRHHRGRRLERRAVAEHREQRDVAAVAPSHHPEPLGIDVRQRLQELHRAHHVVDLVAAVVDGVVVLLAVTGAAAILRADDDVAALDRVLDEREHVDAPVAVHAAVHPDHRGVTAGSAFLQRLKQVRRNVHVADASCDRSPS